MRILLSAGEVSGDVVGARLAAELRQRCPETALWGVGGARMQAAGVDVCVETNHLGTVGISEAFATMPGLARTFLELRRRVKREPTDAAVLIGNDVFNVLLARWLRRHRVRTVSYFPPQVWIWRSLARPIARSFDAMLTCFPEEQIVYRRAGGTASFVGHYLGDALSAPTAAEKVEARRRCGLDGAGRVVGLLPGSRRHELAWLAPVLLDAARILYKKDSSLRFVLPVAEPSFRNLFEEGFARRELGDASAVVEGSHDAMRASDLLLTASGTASLEAALLRVPMVILYRVARLTISVVNTCIGLGLIDSDTVGLPNLVLGRRAIPELIQGRVNAAGLAREALGILESPSRQEQMERDLDEVARRIRGGGAVARAAEAVLAVAAGPPARFAEGRLGAPVLADLPRPAPEGSEIGTLHARDDR